MKPPVRNYQTAFRSCRTWAFTALSLSGLLCSPASSAEPPEKPACDYTIYLEQPLPRAEFITMRKEMYAATQARTAPDTRYTTHYRTGSDQIDEISLGCLGCHEKPARQGSENASGAHATGMARMASSHRVGSDYERAAFARQNLKNSREFPEQMILVNGMLSCVTCHDPLTRTTGRTSSDNDRASLCFSCHNM